MFILVQNFVKTIWDWTIRNAYPLNKEMLISETYIVILEIRNLKIYFVKNFKQWRKAL